MKWKLNLINKQGAIMSYFGITKKDCLSQFLAVYSSKGWSKTWINNEDQK